MTPHPGTILKEELAYLGLSQNQLAIGCRVPVARINRIIHGQTSITPNTALRLAKYFSTSTDFWLKLQLAYDKAKTLQSIQSELDKIHPLERK